MLDERTMKLLEDRGIDPETATRIGIDRHDGQGGGSWISIPYYLGGRLVNHKYRTLGGEKRFYQDTGATKCLWNADVLRDETLAHTALVITEGELDAVIAMQCGYERVVSVPDGAPAQEVQQESTKFEFLEPSRGDLKRCTEIILATDGDGPGQILRDELALRLGRSRCKWVDYPAGTKDLNEVHYRHGPEGVIKLLSGARWLKLNGVYQAHELPPRPEKVPYPTGLPGLDDHYKIRFGEFTVVTGIPSHGKTTLVNDLMCRVADRYGWVVAVAPFEQPPQTELIPALEHWRIGAPPAEAMAEEIERAKAFVAEHFIFVSEQGPARGRQAELWVDDQPVEDPDIDVAWLLERMAAAVLRHNAKICVVDPWNEMDHYRLRDETLTEYTGRAIKMIKRFAQTFDVHVIVVAHPTKLGGYAGKEEPPIPGLYDISDSAHWANKPDVGMVVYRRKGMTLCRVVKVRFQPTVGEPGDTWLKLNRYTGRFEEGVNPKELE